MEVIGKTIKEVMRNFVYEINKNVEGIDAFEDFKTKFEVKGKDMKEALQNFVRKIVDYFEKKGAIFEDLNVEIIPAKKWIIKCSLSGKIYKKISKKFKTVKIEELEENVEFWKLKFYLN